MKYFYITGVKNGIFGENVFIGHILKCNESNYIYNHCIKHNIILINYLEITKEQYDKGTNNETQRD